MSEYRKQLKYKKRIVIKIGTSSLTHSDTHYLNIRVIESLARVITDLKNRGNDIALVTSGAIAVGRQSMHIDTKPVTVSEKQALAAIGQAQLIMTYKRVFSMYNQEIAQLLITKHTFSGESRDNAYNTFHELFKMNVVPVINENDTVATHEIEFGDNDRLSAIVASLCNADLLILLTDTNGLYTSDPTLGDKGALVSEVKVLDEHIMSLASGNSNSNVGTGGMAAKLAAVRMATDAGADVVIANGSDPLNIHRILDGEDIGTLFLAHKSPDFDLSKYIEEY